MSLICFIILVNSDLLIRLTNTTRLWGVSPFFEEEKQDIYTRITLVDYNLDLETDNRISSTAKDFIRKLLIKDLRSVKCVRFDWTQIQ